MGTGTLQHILEATGMDQSEAKLYLAGLKLGASPASEYAKKARMNRITAYNHLEELVRKGTFSAIKRSRGKWYQPIAPDRLSTEARKNTEALERILPDLRGLMGNHHRTPRVRYYEGVEGIRDVYLDTLTAKTDLLNFANSEIVRSFWKEYDRQYVAQRVKRGIRLKGIAPDDEAGKKVQGEDKKSLREIRLVSAYDFPMNNEINIYDNKIAIISFAEDESDVFGVIIESKEVADTQKQIFEMAWRYAALGEGARHKNDEPKPKKKSAVRKDQISIFDQ